MNQMPTKNEAKNKMCNQKVKENGAGLFQYSGCKSLDLHTPGRGLNQVFIMQIREQTGEYFYFLFFSIYWRQISDRCGCLCLYRDVPLLQL